MIKIIKEVGFKRIFKYLIYCSWQWIFDLLPFSPLRIVWLRFGGATIGSDCFIDKIDFINLGRLGLKGLIVGNECFLGRGALLDLADKIILENQVILAARAVLITHFSSGFTGHPLAKKYPKFNKGLFLQKGCFVGINSIILPGIKVGANSLVAAGAVVLKNVSPNCMVAGVPAKIKRK